MATATEPQAQQIEEKIFTEAETKFFARKYEKFLAAQQEFQAEQKEFQECMGFLSEQKGIEQDGSWQVGPAGDRFFRAVAPEEPPSETKSQAKSQAGKQGSKAKQKPTPSPAEPSA